MFRLPIAEDAYLATLTESDAEALLALINANRAHLQLWISWVDDVLTTADALCFITNAQRQIAAGDALYAAVWHRGELAGVVALNYIDRLRGQTEIGYWLGAAYQGRGLVTAACRALVDYAFTHLGLRRVEIRCALENQRSRAVPLRLGFVEEEVQPQMEWQRSCFTRTVVYAIDAETWQRVKGERLTGGR